MPQQIISKLISPWRRTAALRLGLFALLVLSATAFFAGSVQAASYVANYVGANIRDTWVTVTTDGAVSIDLVRTPTGSLGVGKSNVTVKTNSSTGYRLYVSAANHENDLASTAPLYKTDDNTKKILPLSNTASPAAFDPATPNRWGYAIANDGTSSTAGFASASLYEEAANQGLITSNRPDLTWKGMSGDYHVLVNSDTSSENPGITTPVYYGVYVNSGTPESPELGTYRNVIVYTAFIDGGSSVFMTPSAVWDGDTVSIVTEHQNSGDTPVTAGQIEVTLYDSDNASSSVATCDNITVDETRNGSYGNSLEFTCDIHRGADAADKTPYDLMVRINAEDKGIYITYAADDNWAFTKTLASISTMQEITPEICANTPIWNGSSKTDMVDTYILTDNRQNNQKNYLVRRLADGNCWMVQNLALPTGTTISSADSDIAFGSYTIPNANSWSDNTAQYAINGTHKGGEFDTQPAADNNFGSNTNTGNYYSWIVATAGKDSVIANYDMAESICPKGWHLPTAGSNSKDFSKLYSRYTSTANFEKAFGTDYSGACNSGSNCPNKSGYANYWSSTVNSATQGYRLDSDGSDTDPADGNNGKRGGASVRCVSYDYYKYSISYDANGGTGAPVTAVVTKDIEENSTIGGQVNFTISSIQPTRDGYDFLGWSTDPNATTADSAYAPGASVTLTASNPSRKLYAVWEATTKYMQSASTITECKNLSTGTLMEVVDNRDDKHYYVTKLKDGACWMVQNLDLDLYVNNCTTNNKTSGTTGKMGTCKGSTFVEFTSGNTNISGSNWNVSGSNMAYDTQNATGTKWNGYGTTGAAGGTATTNYYEVRSHDPGNTCLTNGTTNATCTPAVGAAETRRDGNYYNWPAATAGTGTYQTAANGIASDSICPKGWHLPYGNNGTSTKQGNTKGGWYYLLNSLGTSSDSALLASPYYLNRSGNYDYSNGSVANRTSYGDYWSSMAASAYYAYYLRFLSSGVYPGTSSSYKGFGFSVRCVAE